MANGSITFDGYVLVFIVLSPKNLHLLVFILNEYRLRLNFIKRSSFGMSEVKKLMLIIGNQYF